MMQRMISVDCGQLHALAKRRLVKAALTGLAIVAFAAAGSASALAQQDDDSVFPAGVFEDGNLAEDLAASILAEIFGGGVSDEEGDSGGDINVGGSRGGSIIMGGSGGGITIGGGSSGSVVESDE